MNKNLLSDYIDACELIKETEEDIARLNKKKREIVQTSVSGSNPEYPYEKRRFHIEGTTFTPKEEARLRLEEKMLEERKENAEKIKRQVQECINRTPVRIQRIIKMKYFDGKTWEEVAISMGRKATADSVRKEVERFFN